MLKRYLIIIIINIVIISFVGFQIFKNKGNCAWSKLLLSNLKYSERAGSKYMSSEGQKAIVIYFSLGCEHCIYQLNVIEKNISKLQDTKIYLITTDINLFTGNFLTKYKTLTNSKSVTFGIVDLKSFQSICKVIRTPTIFFFNKSGKYYTKISGEARIDIIVKILDKIDVRPESK